MTTHMGDQRRCDGAPFALRLVKPRTGKEEDDMGAKDAFEEAQERVKKLSRRPANAELLELYGLYKQATEGDAKGSRPGLLDLKGRAKFDAWVSRKGIAPAAAKVRYVSLVDGLVEKLG
jgi:diazepam-binding inhibitor (GABA receptor modulating acyl-CoA-binding protein)